VQSKYSHKCMKREHKAFEYIQIHCSAAHSEIIHTKIQTLKQ